MPLYCCRRLRKSADWSSKTALTVPGVKSAAAGSVPGCFKMQPPDGSRVRSLLLPFYTVEEAFPYKIYFDRKSLPIAYW